MENGDVYVKIASYSSARVRFYTNNDAKIDNTQSSAQPSGNIILNGYSANPIIN